MPRKDDRHTFLREVELEFVSGKRTARISDISVGGCYIDTIAQVPVGEPLTLKIVGPNDIAMLFRGKVAYLLDGFGFGIEFVDVTPEAQEFLSMIISAQKS